MKAGGTLTLKDACIAQSVQLEWFDTDLDSIILNQDGRRSHVAEIRISAKSDHIRVEHSESINLVLWESIGSDSFVVLAGGDFIEEKEQLLSKVDIHMGNFLSTDGVSVSGSLPVISSVIDLEQLLRDTTIDTHIYTRYRRTIEEFVEYNQIPDVRITEVSSSRLMSGLWTMPAGFSDSIDYVISTQEESAPDILVPQEQFPRASG